MCTDNGSSVSWPCCVTATRVTHTQLAPCSLCSASLFFWSSEPWPQIASTCLSLVQEQRRRARQFLKQNIAYLGGEHLTGAELWRRKGKNNATGLRCKALGLLPAMRHVERGKNFKKSEKLIQAYCKTLEERQRETDSQLRRQLCSEGVTHTFTLSWDLFQNLIPLYLNEEMNCTQLCFQCSFLVPPFLLSRDPSCYLSKSSEWQRMREGSGKTTEGRRKRDGLWLREGIGRKRKSEYSLKVVDPCRN